ncbi:MAG: hypothetical protein Q8R29_00070 [bacterium]|nr:hypothetical protein [bacterium]
MIQNSKFKIQNFLEGFGLVEIIIVTAIVTTALVGFLQTEVLSIKLLRNERQNLEATLLAQETIEAVRSIRDASWTNNISPLINGTTYYPIIQNNKWVLTTTPPPLINGYTRLVILGEVRRNVLDQISPTGTVDAGTRLVTSRVTWGSPAKQIELVTYLTNFQEPLGGPTETKTIFYEGAITDSDLANFPSNNSGNGDPAQGLTTLASPISVSKVELFLKRTTASPSNIFAELRASPVSAVLGVSNIITSTTISNSALTWVEFRFLTPVALSALTKYYIRLRSVPSSNDAFSGSVGTINWGYLQTPPSPYLGGEARRYVGRLSNPGDTGQALDQYDYGFRVYAAQ